MKKTYLHHEDTFELEGLTFKVEFPDDEDAGPPWEQGDGYGIVSDWTRRDKKPGEVVLSTDRSSKRFYDWQATNKKAKEEGWGLTDEHQAELLQRLRGIGTRYVSKSEYRVINNIRSPKLTFEEFVGPVKPLTAGEIRAEAVRRDFEFHRKWCADQWSYVGVVVTLMVEDEDGELVESEDPELSDSLWGVETYDDYHVEVAYENADNIIRVFHDKMAKAEVEKIERLYWETRGVVTV